MPAQAEMDRRLIALVERMDDDSLGRAVVIRRENWVQHERMDRLLLHLFQHQVHHRGQANAMLSGTSVAPPQLDEFFSADEQLLRAADFRALGWTEEMFWEIPGPPPDAAPGDAAGGIAQTD